MSTLASAAALFCLLTPCQSSAPPTQVAVPANLTATIEQTGPRPGDNGKRYLNVEGKAKGKYASFALLRFDAEALRHGLDEKLGAGKYRIKTVTLQLGRSLASFAAAGTVRIYFTPDDSAAVDSLKYPYNANGSALKGLQVGACKFMVTAPSTGAKPAAIASPSSSDMCPLTNRAGFDAMVKHLASGKSLTLVLAEGDANVAATWAGNANTRVTAPLFMVEAAKK